MPNPANLDVGLIFSGKESGVYIKGYDDPDDYTPRIDPAYIFGDCARDIILWFLLPNPDPLWLCGPTGCGKSSVVRQIAARLNYPVYGITGHDRLESYDLTGHLTARGKNMVFEDGTLTQAMRKGGIFLFNEIDLCSPATLAGLNTFLDGSPLCVTENNSELVRPNQMFRVIATANSNGGSNETGLYQGVARQNLAFTDRFIFVQASYPSEDAEINLLGNQFPRLPSDLIKKMVYFANDVRRQFMGENSNANALDVTFSTRALLRWAELTVACQPLAAQGVSPTLYALDRALAFRASSVTALPCMNSPINIFRNNKEQSMNTNNHVVTITPIAALDKLVVLNLETTIWAARRKMTAEDFGGIDLPPADLASLGSKKICDPARVAVFNKLKARAVALLDKHAVRFLGGWAIPEDKASGILNGLGQIKNDFYREKADFLNSYDEAIEEWLNQHETWRDIIVNSIASPSYVDQRLQFAWQVFRVAVSDDIPDNSLEESVANLGHELFSEIAKDAAETWRDVFADRTEVTHKALSPLRTLRDKLAGLSFTTPHAEPVVEIIDAALKSVPAKGKYIGGSSLIMLQGLVCLLKDREALLNQAEAVLKSRSSNRAISNLISSFSAHNSAMPTEAPVKPVQNQPSLDSCGLW